MHTQALDGEVLVSTSNQVATQVSSQLAHASSQPSHLKSITSPTPSVQVSTVEHPACQQQWLSTLDMMGSDPSVDASSLAEIHLAITCGVSLPLVSTPPTHVYANTPSVLSTY
jgi:hypothetical protein